MQMTYFSNRSLVAFIAIGMATAGEANQIFRLLNMPGSGIDGEIEFKDTTTASRAGSASTSTSVSTARMSATSMAGAASRWKFITSSARRMKQPACP